MDSLSHVNAFLFDLFNDRANQLARETGFIKRQRKLTGASFAQGLVFGWWQHPDASLSQLVQTIASHHAIITPSALTQRFTLEAAAFLQALLQELVSHQITSTQREAPIALLQHFRAVNVEDSSQIRLPDTLHALFPGCGTARKGGAVSGLKAHLRWDLLTGSLQGPIITAARVGDHASPLFRQGIAPDELEITDQGYSGLQRLKEEAAHGGFFLQRLKTNVIIFDDGGQRLDLLDIGSSQVNGAIDRWVFLGPTVRLHARLVMVRVSEEVAQIRIERLKRERHEHGTVATPRQMALTHWTMLITNAPQALLSVDNVVVLQRARWQIEILIKCWKSVCQIDEWRGQSPARMLCEIFAKMIAIVIQHWIMLESECWLDPFRSITKASICLQSQGQPLLNALNGIGAWDAVIATCIRSLQAGCRVDRRTKKPALAQLLTEGLNWPIEVNAPP